MLSNNVGVIDVRALPGTHEEIAYHDGGLFPVLTTTTNSTVLAAVRGGAGHLGIDGRVDIVASRDAGRTWSAPAIAAANQWDVRNQAFGISNAGTLILSFHYQKDYDAAGNYLGTPNHQNVETWVMRSIDHGLTWESPHPLGVEPLRYGSPYGKIVAQVDGTLIMSIYDRPVTDLLNGRPTRLGESCSYIVRSRDDGQTWGEPLLVGENMNETGLLALPDGTLLAAMRGEDGGDATHLTRSTDGGITWSAPKQVTDARQHPADLTLLSTGVVLLTYGNRDWPYRIEGRISWDGGYTWAEPILGFSGPLCGYIPNPPTRDLGYPSTTLMTDPNSGNTRGVTAYYLGQPNTEALRTGTKLDFRRRENNPIYSARGYSMVAVGWDESELLTAFKKAT